MKRVILFLMMAMMLAISPRFAAAADVEPPKIDLSTPVAPVELFLKAMEKDDLDTIRRVLSNRLRERFKSPEKLKEFLAVFQKDKVIRVIGADPPEERDGNIRTRVKVIIERDGKEREAGARVIREGMEWRWDET